MPTKKLSRPKNAPDTDGPVRKNVPSAPPPEKQPGLRPPEKPPVYGEEIDPPFPRPLVFVPGIMGSRIRLAQPAGRPDIPLWPPFGLGTTGALRPLGANSPKVAGGDHALLSGAYDELIDNLNKIGYSVKAKTLGIFGYDWTQSNRDSGAQLKTFIDQTIDEFNRFYRPNPPCTSADVVNHSMGGLVTRSAFLLHGAAIEKVVYVASPHYGAPKAYLVLHPETQKHFNFFGDFLSKFIAESGWKFLRDPGDYATLDVAFKDIAPRFPSVWELMPDEFYLNGQRSMVFEDQPGIFRGEIPIVGVHDTYGHESPAAQRQAWQFPATYDGLIRNALKFKRDLGETLPGTQNLVIYCGELTTEDEALFHYPVPYRDDFQGARSSDQKGDGTVPTDSGSMRSKRAEPVTGSHSALPNHPDTFAKIQAFLKD